MSNYIVLVKQVPDISQISENVFNPETGTLVRSKLKSVINPLDEQALGFACKMRNIGGINSKIVALTMGPSSAEEVLRYALARGADEGVLLSDKRLGGADTWATACSLSCAIKKIVAVCFDGNTDYFVVCGMQSIDGDTAQVPPQIAESLQIGCAAYATDVQYRDNNFEFTHITANSSGIIRVKAKPAVITVAKYDYSPFATLQSTRKANIAPIIRWDADDVGAHNLGVSGSKTQVVEIFSPGKTNRKCRKISSPKEFARLIISEAKADILLTQPADAGKKYVLPQERTSFADRSFEYTEKENEHYKVLAKKLSQAQVSDLSKLNDETVKKVSLDLSTLYHEMTISDMLEGLKTCKSRYKGDVWVVAEVQNKQIHPSTFELLGKARELADCLCVKAAVAVLSEDFSMLPIDFRQQLIACGADLVCEIKHPLLREFEPVCFKKALVGALSLHRPQIVLFSATPQGRVLAPMVAFSLGCGLTADCTGLEIKDISRKGEIAILLQTRPALGGNIMASIYTKNSDMQFAGVRPGVFKPLKADAGRTGQIVEYHPNLCDRDVAVETISTEQVAQSANFEADAVICGGKGLQSADNYKNLLKTLSNKLSDKCGITAEVAATRAAVEHGFIGRAYQVGQTGSTICPKIYLGLGVSGAIQHIIGISASQTILAINNDPAADIFKHSDYYMVGSVEDIVPQIIQEIENYGKEGKTNGG